MSRIKNKCALALFQCFVVDDAQVVEVDEYFVDVLKGYANDGVVFDKRIDACLIMGFHKELYALRNPSVQQLIATRYKNFSDVANRSELLLQLEAIVYYLTGHKESTHDINIVKDLESIRLFKYVGVLSTSEFEAKVDTLIEAKVALSDETINTLISVYENVYKYDVSVVGNRDLKRELIKRGHIVVTKLDDVMRLVLSVIFDIEGSIIKRQCVNRLKVTYLLSDYQHSMVCRYMANLEPSAYKDVNRWRQVLIHLRRLVKNDGVKRQINQLLRKAKTKAVPYQGSVLSNVLAYDLERIKKALTRASVFEIVRVINYIEERWYLKSDDRTKDVLQRYLVRNGKTYIKPLKSVDNRQFKHERDVHIVCMMELFNRYRDKNIVIVRKKSAINLVMPTSERQNFGEYPELSYVVTKHKPVVGISWQGEPVAHVDIDLHTVDLNGSHVGWNSSKKGFSGDMTHLNNYGYASEYFEGLSAGLQVTVNGFYVPKKNYPYDILISDDVVSHKEYCIDPKTIKARVTRHIETSGARNIVTVVSHKDGYASVLTSGNMSGLVPKVDLVKHLPNIISRKVESALTLSRFCELAGIKLVENIDDLDDNVKEEAKVIDLSDDKLKFTSLVELMDV